jgi:hypothetical protein
MDNQVKRALDERGRVWWTDGAPDLDRHMARNTVYAAWFEALDQDPDRTQSMARRARRIGGAKSASMALRSSASRVSSAARRLSLIWDSSAALGMAITLGSRSTQASAISDGVASIAWRWPQGLGVRQAPLADRAVGHYRDVALGKLGYEVELRPAPGDVVEDLIGGATFSPNRAKVRLDL